MIKFEIDIDIDRAPEDVFAYLTDPDSLPEWQGADEVEQLTDGPVGVGTQFREVHSAGPRKVESVTEVTEYVPGSRFAIRIVEGPIPLDGAWRREPIESGTRLHFTGEGPGPVRILEPLMKVGMRSQFRRHHKRLKAALER